METGRAATAQFGGKDYYFVEDFEVRSNGQIYNQKPPAYEYDGFDYIDKTYDEGTHTISFFYERRYNRILYWDGAEDEGDGPVEVSNTSLGESERIPVGDDCGSAEGFMPEKRGYKFQGWYIDEKCETPFDFSSTEMTKEGISIYAKWRIKEYDVILHTMITESVNWASPQPTEFRVKYGETIPAIASATTRSQELVGWYYDEKYEKLYLDETVMDGDLTTAYSDHEPDYVVGRLDLFAQWRFKSELTQAVKIEYDVNLGNDDDLTKVTDSGIYKDRGSSYKDNQILL